MADAPVYEWQGFRYGVMPDYLRITQNPVAPDYPTVGQIVTLKGHKKLKDGDYLVTRVQEFEPPEHPDLARRDIRVSVLSRSRCSYPDMQGVELLRAIVATRQGTVVRHTPL